MLVSEREKALTAFYNTNVFRWHRMSEVTRSRLERAIKEAGLQPHLITTRVKSLASFVDKGLKLGEGREGFKYEEPERQITDLVGIRIVVAIADDIPPLAAVVRRQVDVVEEASRGNEDEGTPPGYQSLHLVARLRADDPAVTEFPALVGDPCIEIQVRSILQDAYASFNHDLDYKGERPVAGRVRRQLHVLAAVLDLADREFARVRAEHLGDVDPAVEPGVTAAPSGWTENSLDELVRHYVGQAERDSRPWLLELRNVLLALGFADAAGLEALEAELGGGTELAAQLRASRPWVTGSQVLDVLLQRALGDAYLDRRAGHLPHDKQKQLKLTLRSESVGEAEGTGR